jgi:hypothetical protein
MLAIREFKLKFDGALLVFVEEDDLTIVEIAPIMEKISSLVVEVERDIDRPSTKKMLWNFSRVRKA